MSFATPPPPPRSFFSRSALRVPSNPCYYYHIPPLLIHYDNLAGFIIAFFLVRTLCSGVRGCTFFLLVGVIFLYEGFHFCVNDFQMSPVGLFFSLLLSNCKQTKNEGDEERDEGKSRENEVALRCILYYIIEHIKHKSAMLYICIFLVVVGTGGKQKKK